MKSTVVSLAIVLVAEKNLVTVFLFSLYILDFGVALKSTFVANKTESEMSEGLLNVHTYSEVTPTEKPTDSAEFKNIWITDIFREAEKKFNVDSTANEHCRRDFNIYKVHLRNQTVWAVRMFESSEWPSVGVLSGKTYHLGNWDECITAKGPGVKGQYCLADISINLRFHLKFMNDTTGGIQWPDEESSAWDVITMFAKNPFRLDRHKMKWAMCIPSSCTPDDLQKSLNNTLTPLFRKYDLSTTINVDPLLCSVQNSTYPPGYYFTSGFFVILIGTVISSSIYDVYNYKIEGTVKRNSLHKFTRIDPQCDINYIYNFLLFQTTNPGIYFIKIIYIILLICGHRLYHILAYPTFPVEKVEMEYQPMNMMFVGLTVIDVFFMLGGFLTFHLGFDSMEKGGFSYLCSSILLRWVRIMPVVIILLLFTMFILPYVGEGPLWKYRVFPTVETCKATWWTNLMAIGNIVNADKQCLPISWCVSVDMQLSILGGTLLLIITKWKEVGAVLLFAVFLLAVEVDGMLVYRWKYHGTLLLYLKTFKDHRESKEFYRLHISTITRVGAYLVGFQAAFLTKILKKKKYIFTAKQKVLIVIGTFLIGKMIQLYGFIFYDHSRQYIALENAIYAAFKRPLFVLPIASLLCIYFTSGLGKFNKLFEWKAWIPWGRLVYSVFFVHCIIQMYHASSQREYSLIPATLNEYWLVCSDVINSFLIGVIMYMISEGPVNSMTKLLHSYLTRPEITIPEHRSRGTLNHAFENTEMQSNFVETVSC